jgi:REP element-mobilizing transposase RayT
LPRAARIHYPGGVFHLISRFFEKRFMLDSDGARRKYLELVARTAGAVDAQVLGYCLMSSHVHMVVRAGDMPLERLLKPVNTGFAVWKNLQLGGRKGPVFADRYKAILVDGDAYLLELLAYVHNNPVRAGLAATAAESDWSSHRAYVGHEPAPRWLNVGLALAMLNERPTRAAAIFEEYVRERRSEERNPVFSGQGHGRAARMVMRAVGDAWRLSDAVVGDDEFIAKVQRDLAESDDLVTRGSLQDVRESFHLGTSGAERPSFASVVELACEQCGLDRVDFESRPKSAAGILARRLITLVWVRRFGGTQAEVARGLKVLSPNVSRWYAAGVRSLADLEPLVDRLESAARNDKLAMKTASSGKVRYSLEVSDDTN